MIRYNPIQKFGPSDCVASINSIIEKFDALVKANNTAAIDDFKALFGLQSLPDIRDFAATIAFPLGGPLSYPTDSWQELNWRNQYDDFWSFCSNVTNLDAPEGILQVDSAMAKYTIGEPWTNLGNYAHYVKATILPTCRSGQFNSPRCFGTQNSEERVARTQKSLA